ncbi:hypothetical protein BS50DRAFT_642377 [Corynespora cassiicola Philippines]|uniref:Uncharacterized protein n=1 Tax=Corynespora cassiicola Philippines TaxID=1448308 RepID=A0A2T2P947_CORCC|nr:hypothetical protein BS50DRAFT_642377 [Corynespora cassiicola Philippines]
MRQCNSHFKNSNALSQGPLEETDEDTIGNSTLSQEEDDGLSLFVPGEEVEGTHTAPNAEENLNQVIAAIDPILPNWESPRGGGKTRVTMRKRRKRGRVNHVIVYDYRVGITDANRPADEVSQKDTSAIALHGQPLNSTRGLAKKLYQKGVSAYNDSAADIENAGNEAILSNLMIKWFQIVHAIDNFPPGEEPLPGTYDCRLCHKDLSRFHHTYGHTHSCTKKQALEKAGKLVDALYLMSQPCNYQECDHQVNLHTFVDCREVFSTLKERGEHTRSHVRTMKKQNDNGNKVITCFFGDCAANPQGGRLRRDGPEFLSDEDRLSHL